MDYVLGFTCVNDVTLRDLQGIDPTWTRAKGFDTSCPLGPWIVMRDDLDWKDAKISFTLNGEDVPMASGTTANLIHGIPDFVVLHAAAWRRHHDRHPERLRPPRPRRRDHRARRRHR